VINLLRPAETTPKLPNQRILADCMHADERLWHREGARKEEKGNDISACIYEKK